MKQAAYSTLVSVMRALALFAAMPIAALAADASLWHSLLKQYVNPESRVDYAKWKADGTASLDSYLQQLAQPWPKEMAAGAEKAELIDAYNALTVRWILQNYPLQSIWRTHHPFTEARHTIDGRKVSLDAIETRLRNMSDPRIHGTLVCASLSCPPLRREAYTADRIDAQLDDNVHAWLTNEKLNQLSPDKHEAAVSMIFKWYRGDFDAASGSVANFLAKFVPGEYKSIKHIPYHWGLNDTSDIGKKYSNFDFLRDKVKDSL